MRKILMVVCLGLISSAGLWWGQHLARAQTCGGGNCTEECNYVENPPLGAQASHQCTYKGVSSDGTSACSCGPNKVGIPGWCRYDTCKSCKGISSSAEQCQQDQSVCQDGSQQYSLCQNSCQ